jgi:hypothetical protein
MGQLYSRTRRGVPPIEGAYDPIRRLERRCKVHRLLLVLTVGLAAAAAAAPRPALPADASFEGVVTYRHAAAPGTPPLIATWLLKGSRSRMEFEVAPGTRSVVIMDVKTGAVISLMPGQKQYMASNLYDFAKAMPDVPSSKYSPTGRSETIAGRKCDHYLIGTAEAGMDLCIAKGMGYSTGSGIPALSTWDDLRKAFPDGHFPLKIEGVSATGRQLMMEATRIEAKALPDSLFVPPPGYTEFKAR